jgi:hypothetical protein
MFSKDLFRSLVTIILFAAGLQIAYAAEKAGEINGPLRLHPTNPRYFTDDTGKAVLLTGSHTWNNLVDMAPPGSNAEFDYDAYLDWMAAYPHNFMRLWAWELLSWDTSGNREKKAQIHRVRPQPWQRTGPGNALDGKPKFDLTKFNDEYFTRLRRRVDAAGDRGIYTAVMLFEGWGIQFSPDGWRNHPFHPQNNINGIDGDLDGDGQGLEIHQGRNEAINKVQRDYVRKVIDTVNDLDNVLYEISNENHPGSTEWQYGMIRFIKQCENAKPKQHPVGMTFQYKGGSNETLMKSPADWVSPNPDGGYRDNPPAADGSKVIVTDTDHLWGIGGNSTWVWKSFLRGLNPIFMDPYDGAVLSKGFGRDKAEPIRKSLGQVLDWSRRVDLVGMTPRSGLASSRYCLAKPNAEYLVFLPGDGKEVTVKVPTGKYESTWFETVTGKERKQEPFTHAGGERSLKSPFEGDSLLYVRRL